MKKYAVKLEFNTYTCFISETNNANNAVSTCPFIEQAEIYSTEILAYKAGVKAAIYFKNIIAVKIKAI